MSEVFKIQGGKPLAGEIFISGSKNAALPIVCASLLNSGTTVLQNIPLINDILNVLRVLEIWGARVSLNKAEHEVRITNAELEPQVNEEANSLIRKLRGSILLLGPVLSRFGSLSLPLPGGDVIGARPLDAHLEGFVKLGAGLIQEGELISLKAPAGLQGAKVVLREISVTATENLILAASLARGETTIKLAATEPHVQDLCNFLGQLGVRIEGVGTNILHIWGLAGQEIRKDLTYKIVPDSDQAMNLAALVAATRSEVVLKNIDPEFVDAGLYKLEEVGVNFELGRDFLVIKKPAGIYKAAKYQSGFYPKLMSDQLPPFAVLATQAQGVSLIQEWMYEGRLGYITELVKMGANAMLLDPHRALIVGPTPLRGAELKSLDIRAGLTAIIAGLVAEGETTILDAQIIDRGFESIDERLRALGAQIERVKAE